MTFLVAAALGVFALVVLPLAAHLLRRGRADTLEFPPVRLVPTTAPVARQRARLEDRALLALRAAMIGLLAVLGATPFVRCSRLSLSRTSGASVAVAIVLDDSMSMKTVTENGETRWSVAVAGAKELVASARPGDAIAVILAGAPARVALGSTTDLATAAAALDELTPSDRRTALEDAVRIARSAIAQLPHEDRRVVVLSDLAGGALPEGEPPAWTPIEALRRRADDCGIVSAEARGQKVVVSVACNAAAAASGRTVSAEVAAVLPEDAAPGARTSSTRIEAPLALRDGVQVVVLDAPSPVADGTVQLSGGDSLADDDVAVVERAPRDRSLALVGDPTWGAVRAGGPTILEQALAALDAGLTVRPLPSLPDSASQLGEHAAVILDDPPGLAADARTALAEWLERGGLALALLGPAAPTAPLGSTLEPFAGAGARWEAPAPSGLDTASIAWIGDASRSLADLSAKGRVRFGAALPGTVVVGAWSDGSPFLVRRPVGRGAAWTAGLPSSADRSDFPLRPGFLALLERFVDDARRRVGARASPAGEAWIFPGASDVRVTGPAGPVPVIDARADCRPEESHCAEAGKRVVPAVRGRYEVLVDGDAQTRVVTIAPEEVLAGPREPAGADAVLSAAGTERTFVDVSREVALALLALFLAELGVRTYRQRARGEARRRRGDPPDSPRSDGAGAGVGASPAT